MCLQQEKEGEYPNYHRRGMPRKQCNKVDYNADMAEFC